MSTEISPIYGKDWKLIRPGEIEKFNRTNSDQHDGGTALAVSET